MHPHSRKIRIQFSGSYGLVFCQEELAVKWHPSLIKEKFGYLILLLLYNYSSCAVTLSIMSIANIYMLLSDTFPFRAYGFGIPSKSGKII